MIKELEFVKIGTTGPYEAKFESEGLPVTVQLERQNAGAVAVLGNLPGMKPTLIDSFQNMSDSGIAFVVDFPKGMEVTLRCGYNVTVAKIMDDSENTEEDAEDQE